MKRRNVAGVVTLTGLFAAVWALVGWQLPPGRAVATPLAPPSPTGEFQFTGTASCSGRSCHGGLGGPGDKNCEYTTFVLNDPHLKAYRVLFEERSKVMLRNFLQRPVTTDLKELHPEQAHACLKCHGPEMDAVLQAKGQVVRPVDGFGCESCHGPASKWKDPHTAGQAWRDRPDEEKLALGFQPMTTMAARAGVCVSCHVGSPERDVNHDLYGAGHPRLMFAFETFLANEPRHWQKSRDTDLASAWIVGQVVTAEAALKLLEVRAKDDKRPWPEFAEYDCYACHHDLKADQSRQKRGYEGRVAGTLPWNDWYFAMPLALAASDSPLAQKSLAEELLALRKLMSKPLPTRGEVSKHAQTLAGRMRGWLGPKPAEPNIAALIQGPSPLIFKDYANAETVPGWDVAAQLAVALRAQYEAGLLKNPDRKNKEDIDKSLMSLFKLLEFGSEKKMPLDSPDNFDGPKFVKQLRETSKLIQQ